jgi:protein phosphatase
MSAQDGIPSGWRLGGVTDPGRVRSRNEDAFGLDAAAGVLVVADGMGGYRGGEVAARLAVETFVVESGRRRAAGEPPESALAACVDAAHRAIVAHARENPGLEGMGCTLVAAWLCAEGVWIAHVGDARAYGVGPEEMRSLTDDHSHVADLVRTQELSAEAARTHPLRNVVTRALGVSGRHEPEVMYFAARPQERLLLCSDGLWTMLADESLHEGVWASADPGVVAEGLLRDANDAGGRDNITIALAFPPEGG